MSNNGEFSSCGLPDHDLIRQAFFRLELFRGGEELEAGKLRNIAAARGLSDMEKADLQYHDSLNVSAAFHAARTILKHEPKTPPEVIAAFLSSLTIRELNNLPALENRIGKTVLDIIVEGRKKLEKIYEFSTAPRNLQLFGIACLIYGFSAPAKITKYDPALSDSLTEKFKTETKEFRTLLYKEHPRLALEVENAFRQTLRYFNDLSRKAPAPQPPRP